MKSNIVERVTAPVVLSVRNQQKRLFRMRAFLKFFQADINGILQRRSSISGYEHQLVAKSADIRREILTDFRSTRKLHKKVLVVGIACLQKVENVGNLRSRFDLDKRTIRFTRSNGVFRAENMTLQWNTATGSELKITWHFCGWL